MTDRDLCFVPATALQRLYRARKTSPLEVMKAVLARIDAVNPRVNAYVTVVRESALAAARKATAALTRRSALGPLAQGSDLGGSLRTPAAFCGVVGFRTSPGLIPVYPADLGWDSSA